VSLRKLPAVHRQEIAGASDRWVVFEPLLEGARLPLLARPVVEGVSLAGWAGDNRRRIAELLLFHGGILFRGFAPGGAEGLRRFAEEIGGDALAYRERSSPRHEVSPSVYTSTDHPADQEILLHNENSYAWTWPRKIFFYCARPALAGGETPLADSRAVLARIAPEIRERFQRAGVMYLRNFGDGCGLTWQQAFQTEDPAAVEAYCRSAGMGWEWKAGGRLRTNAVRPAIATHPVTAEAVWFNQVPLFHPAALDPATREFLAAEFAPDDLPLTVRYGDGAAIEDEVVAALLAVYRRETVAFSWQQGDLLALDNLLVAHGRAAFQGSREILVAMAEEGSWTDV
jgi:alpha-ketoglutarate-dependent taurine dioxygenase